MTIIAIMANIMTQTHPIPMPLGLTSNFFETLVLLPPPEKLNQTQKSAANAKIKSAASGIFDLSLVFVFLDKLNTMFVFLATLYL